MLLFIFLIFNNYEVHASDNTQARIGNNYFGSLEEAIEFSDENDIILLTTDIKVDESLQINKKVNINLNNHDIKAKEKVFLIDGGNLNLSGTGKIYEEKPNYGAIILVGSDNPDDKNYSTVNIGSGIFLEGWSGIFINQKNKTGYGITINMNGRINAVDDLNNDSGVGIYVNGQISNEENYPVINLSDTVSISSSGVGIYAAGYAEYNINGAYISGFESSLGIKSGIFNINSGTFIGSGADKTPTSGNYNGINASGTAIQIESNSKYKGNIEINIKNGTFKSKNSNVIYEYTADNTATKVKSINISNGKFISENNKNIFLLSDSFKNKFKAFITGGKYSSNPKDYLKTDYKVNKNNDLYEIINNESSVFAFKDMTSNNYVVPILFICFIIIFYFVYKSYIKKPY